MERPKITICIPTHEMQGKAKDFLLSSLQEINNQTFRNFEIVVTDDSKDNIIQEVCLESSLPIRYFRNEIRGMASNTNAGIKRARGELIKILYLDDRLAHKDALKDIVENFKGHWLITGVNDNVNPYYTHDIHTGNNKLGSPSALTILNDNPLLFDENMSWLLDCDYYKRMYEKYGEPVILNGVNVIIEKGSHQMTNILTSEDKKSEEEYINKKYA